MGPFDYVLIALAALTLGAYVCRLAQLHLSTNRPLIILMHVSLALSTISGGKNALNGADWGDWVAVIGAACWIGISYTTWRHGVPEHFETRPADLEPLEFPKISGGKDQ